MPIASTASRRAVAGRPVRHLPIERRYDIGWPSQQSQSLPWTPSMRVLFPPKLEMQILTRLGRAQPRDPRAAEGEASEIKKTYSHRPLRPTVRERTTPNVLPVADVIRALVRYRYDARFRGERRVPIRTLAGLVGLSHETLYAAIRMGNASERTCNKLAWSLKAIAEGRLQFRRRRQVWEPENLGGLGPRVTPLSR
jgi:hypothetical protein